MILYKALIVLTVIFDIACCLNYVKEFMEHKEHKECTKILKKVGLIDDWPFYNLNFLLKFENQTEFIKHINTEIKIKNQTKVSLPKKVLYTILCFKDEPTSEIPEEKDSDIPTDNHETLPEHTSIYSYLIEFYSQIIRRNKYFLEKSILTPVECCTAMRKLQVVKILEHLNNFVSGKLQVGEDDNVEVNDVDKVCKNSILGYTFETYDVEYKYDENNRYRNFFTSFMIVNSFPYQNDKENVVSNMNDDVKGYFNYHATLAFITFKNNKLFDMYSPKVLCDSYLSKKKDEMKKKKEEKEKIKKINEETTIGAVLSV